MAKGFIKGVKFLGQASEMIDDVAGMADTLNDTFGVYPEESEEMEVSQASVPKIKPLPPIKSSDFKNGIILKRPNRSTQYRQPGLTYIHTNLKRMPYGNIQLHPPEDPPKGKAPKRGRQGSPPPVQRPAKKKRRKTKKDPDPNEMVSYDWNDEKWK